MEGDVLAARYLFGACSVDLGVHVELKHYIKTAGQAPTRC